MAPWKQVKINLISLNNNNCYVGIPFPASSTILNVFEMFFTIITNSSSGLLSSSLAISFLKHSDNFLREPLDECLRSILEKPIFKSRMMGETLGKVWKLLAVLLETSLLLAAHRTAVTKALIEVLCFCLWHFNSGWKHAAYSKHR